MMRFKFGDVVLVEFPFTNQSNKKKRPAVIVSNDVYNAAKLDVVIMAITSRLSLASRPGEILVSQWRNAGLVKPSAFKPVFATIEQSLIIRQLGTLSADDQMALRKAIGELLR